MFSFRGDQIKNDTEKEMIQINLWRFPYFVCMLGINLKIIVMLPSKREYKWKCILAMKVDIWLNKLIPLLSRSYYREKSEGYSVPQQWASGGAGAIGGDATWLIKYKQPAPESQAYDWLQNEIKFDICYLPILPFICILIDYYLA